MMAITALWATVCPNVGPTLLAWEPGAPPNLAASACLMWLLPRLSGLEVIWNWVPLLPIAWTTGSWTPAELTTERTADDVAGLARVGPIRAPEVKSMPRFSPRPPMARAPMSRMTPDREKKYFEAPMKS